MTERFETIIVRQQLGPTELTASLFDELPGLAIHSFMRDYWNVTHLRSGLKIMGGFASKEIAIEAARELITVADFAADGDTLRENADAIRALRDSIIKKYNGTRGGGTVDNKVPAPDIPDNLKKVTRR